MRIRGLIELTDRMNPDLVRRLTAAAYTASRGGIVVLVLRGIPVSRVEALLDPLVRKTRCSQGGVLYRRAGEGDEELFVLAAQAEFVVAASPEWTSTLRSRGIVPIPPREGLGHLSGNSVPAARSASSVDRPNSRWSTRSA